MIADFAGPLGQPSEFVHDSPGELSRKRILFVAGGVGTAPVYPQVKWPLRAWYQSRCDYRGEEQGYADFRQRDGSRGRKRLYRHG